MFEVGSCANSFENLVPGVASNLNFMLELSLDLKSLPPHFLFLLSCPWYTVLVCSLLWNTKHYFWSSWSHYKIFNHFGFLSLCSLYYHTVLVRSITFDFKILVCPHIPVLVGFLRSLSQLDQVQRSNFWGISNGTTVSSASKSIMIDLKYEWSSNVPMTWCSGFKNIAKVQVLYLVWNICFLCPITLFFLNALLAVILFNVMFFVLLGDFSVLNLFHCVPIFRPI